MYKELVENGFNFYIIIKMPNCVLCAKFNLCASVENVDFLFLFIFIDHFDPRLIPPCGKSC